MFNLKIGGIVAGTAFILSLLIGLVSRSAMPVLLIRPFIFAVLFFIVSGLVYQLVSRFLPELLNENGFDESMAHLPGSRINITEEGAPPPSAQAFFGAMADDSDDELGNISDLARRSPSPQSAGGGTLGMDQNARDSYNRDENLGEFSEPELLSPEEPSPGGTNGGSGAAVTAEAGSAGGIGFPDSVDMLPDLDSMAGAFLPSSADEEPDTTEYSVSTPARKPPSGAKTSAWAGDFNAKDMAEGLRTILNKEKEG